MKQNLLFSSPATRLLNVLLMATKRPPPASDAVLFVNSRMVPGDNKSYISIRFAKKHGQKEIAAKWSK